MRLIVDAAPLLIAYVDAEKRIQFANRTFLEFFGLCAAAVRGRLVADVVGAEAANVIGPHHAQALSGRHVSHESLIPFRGGRRRWMNVQLVPRVRDDRRTDGFLVLARDVTPKREAEAALRPAEAHACEQLAEMKHDEIVGTSQPMREVLREVELVAVTDATVLVTGETGTGKELVARALHERSRRRGSTLVTVNCAALPAGLIESELFGHEAGAFTGALSRKIGRFEAAQAGSIFLDEIGDLPLELQAKLLRVLEDGECQRVGSAHTMKVDVRVIAATNQDLEQAVAQGRFRADLFYRLNVFPIRLPPLRERQDDIAVLARFFAMHFGSAMGKHIESIPPRTLQALTAYSWPGNVRELQNVIERAMIVTRGPELELGAWPPAAAVPGPTTTVVAAATTLEDVERHHIRTVLERTGWRVSGERGAAKLLGLKATTLASRMKRLGISRLASA